MRVSTSLSCPRHARISSSIVKQLSEDNASHSGICEASGRLPSLFLPLDMRGGGAPVGALIFLLRLPALHRGDFFGLGTVLPGPDGGITPP